MGSPTSLRVIKGGCHAQWKQIKNAVNFVGKAGAFFHTVNPLKPKEEIKERFSEVNKILLQVIISVIISYPITSLMLGYSFGNMHITNKFDVCLSIHFTILCLCVAL